MLVWFITGILSTFPTVLLFAAILVISLFAGFYGVALAASAMMATMHNE
jgi:K(+)-stimulated pyrophosphate-energized sodium pump